MIDFGGLNETAVAAFGSTVTHFPDGGYEQEIAAIRLDPAVLGEITPGVVMVLDAPTAAFAASPRKNDIVEVGGAEYRVFRVESDEGGMTRLSLTQ